MIQILTLHFMRRKKTRAKTENEENKLNEMNNSIEINDKCSAYYHCFFCFFFFSFMCQNNNKCPKNYVIKIIILHRRKRKRAKILWNLRLFT